MTRDSDKVLIAENVSKKYKDFSALSEISFDLHQGEILSFIGPNGAGKTTLLKILSGFLTSDSGKLMISQVDRTNDLNQLNQLVSTVFGGGTGFYKNASVKENLDFFATLAGLKKSARNQKISEVLNIVHLEAHEKKAVGELSMGMLQRLHIARGLLKDSPILLLDEPTNGVDAEMSKDIRALVKEIAHQGRAIILTSHILHEVSDLADRIILINQGSIAFSGSLENIIEESGIYYINRPATLEESYLELMKKLGDSHG